MADLSSILGGLKARPIDIKAEADKWLSKGFDPANQYAQFGMSPPLRNGDMASIGLDMAPGIGDIKSGIEGIQAMTKGDSLGAVLGGLGALPVVPGFAGIFAGAKAKTADLAKLARAEDMFKAGAPREAIWNETGWWQGPDQQWRFEIPDNEARYNLAGVHLGENFSSSDWNNSGLNKRVERIFSKQQADSVQAKFPEHKPTQYALDQWSIGGDVDKGVPAEVLLEHPRFEQAYPDLKVTVTENPWLKSLASLHDGPDGGEVTLRGAGAGPAFAERNKNLMLHELQHGVQGVEGFASGGSPDMAFRDPRMWGAQGAAGSDIAWKMLQDKMQGLRSALPVEEYAKQAWGSSEVTPEITSDYHTNYLPSVKKTLSPELEASLQKTVAQEWYKRLAGEAEARLTQSRMNMTPQERQARPPWTMFDVPESEQIIRR